MVAFHLHAPRYKVEFLDHHVQVLALARLFHPRSRQNASLALSIEIDEGDSSSNHLTFDGGILFQTDPFS